MESKLALLIFLVGSLIIIGVAVFLVFSRSKSGQSCGGAAFTPCPAGYTCQVTEDAPDAIGQCVSSIDPFLEKAYSVFPGLRPR